MFCKKCAKTEQMRPKLWNIKEEDSANVPVKKNVVSCISMKGGKLLTDIEK